MLDFLKKRAFQIKKEVGVKKVRLEPFAFGDHGNGVGPVEIGGLVFNRLVENSRGDAIIGVDEKEEYFIKIGIRKNEKKKWSVEGESRIISSLNNRGAISCPKLVGSGVISGRSLGFADHPLSYYITEFIKSSEKCTFADIVFSILEQKSLGVYQGDVKPANILYSEEKGVAFLVDYDQAEELNENVVMFDNNRFFEWINEVEKKKYGHESWLRHFCKYVNKKYFQSLFRNGSFDLSNTSLYLKQRTTNAIGGVYHTLVNDTLYADGVRGLSDRESFLDNIELTHGEKVLDIGCNVGLLTMYLEGRGCRAYGYELDPSIVTAAQMISNILNLNIKYKSVDLDYHEFTESFDTIFLFSVFHHTENMVANGKKIASVSKRVIIECRLEERGKKPLSSGETGWVETSKWSYDNLEDLYKGLEGYFPGMVFYKNHGSVDKGRFIIELRRN